MVILHLLILSLLGLPTVSGWSIHIQPSGERLLHRVAGQNFFAICSVKDYDGPASDVQINWIHANEVIRSGGRVMTSERPSASQLMIIKSKKSDSGDYMCQVKIAGELKLETAHITFITAPHFIDPKTEQHPEDGTDAEIICKVEGEPGLEVFWQRNGETIGESTSRAYEFKDDKQVLVIPRFDAKKDDGLYLCNAAQFSSFETLSINVTAYSRPSITVFESPKEDLGYEGQTAQFKCAATGKPLPTYTWYKIPEDEEILPSDLYTVEGGLLVVHSLAASNSGQYKCVATNEIGEDEKTAELKVFLRPSVDSIKDETKEGGEEVVFTCGFQGEGNVHAKFVFGEEEFKIGGEDEEEDGTNDDETEPEETDEEKKEDEEDGNGDDEEEGGEGKKDGGEEEDEVTTHADDDGEEEEAVTEDGDDGDDDVAEELHDAEMTEDKNEDEEKEGEEETHDIHKAGIEHVDAILVPETEMEDEEVVSTTEADDEKEEPTEGDDKDEDDENDKDAAPTGEDKDEDEKETKKWRRFVRDVTSERVSVTEDNGVLTLTIRQLTQQDAGKYQCIVENEAGRTVRNATLSITHAPEILSFDKEPIRVFDGQDFTLTCTASAVPEPVWKWTKGTDELEADGSRITIESDADSTTLTVRDAAKGDFGSIECEASNGVGEPATASMTVVRVVAPATPGEPECREHVYPNFGLCSLDESVFETEDGDGTPTSIVFFYADFEAVEKNADFDFRTSARNFTVPYNAEKMYLKPLIPNHAYSLRAMAVNEAGESELSQKTTLETTDPWAPAAPSEVEVKCDSSCEVSWVEPSNHGDFITNYDIEVAEKETTDGEHVETVATLKYTVEADVESFVLPSMKPNTRYEISVIAENTIGESAPTTTVIDTPDTVRTSLSFESFCNPKMIAIFLVILVLVLVLIDCLCFVTFRCGVLACCLGRCKNSAHKKETSAKDLESGKGGESGRLLDGSAR